MIDIVAYVVIGSGVAIVVHAVTEGILDYLANRRMWKQVHKIKMEALIAANNHQALRGSGPSETDKAR